MGLADELIPMTGLALVVTVMVAVPEQPAVVPVSAYVVVTLGVTVMEFEVPRPPDHR